MYHSWLAFRMPWTQCQAPVVQLGGSTWLLLKIWEKVSIKEFNNTHKPNPIQSFPHSKCLCIGKYYDTANGEALQDTQYHTYSCMYVLFHIQGKIQRDMGGIWPIPPPPFAKAEWIHKEYTTSTPQPPAPFCWAMITSSTHSTKNGLRTCIYFTQHTTVWTLTNLFTKAKMLNFHSLLAFVKV